MNTLGSQVFYIIYLTIIFFLNFLSRIVIAPLMPVIKADMGLSYGEAGSLFLLISLGYCIMLALSGYVSFLITHRNTIIISSIIVGLTLLFVAFSNNLWEIKVGLFLLGMTAGLYLPSGIATITSLIGHKDWGKAIAIHELAPNMGFVTAPFISEFLLKWYSWRSVLAFIGLVSILLGIAYIRFGRGGKFHGEAPKPYTMKILLSEPSFWIMIALFSVAIGGSLGIYTMLPLYLVTEHGMERNSANVIISLSRVLGLGMVFLAGWITDRIGPRRTMTGVFIATGMMTLLLGEIHGGWIILAVFLQPLMAVCFFPAGFTALSMIGPSQVRNIAVSFTIPIAFLMGGGIIPTWIGIIGEIHSLRLGIDLVGGFILMSALLARSLSYSRDQ